MQDVVGLGGSAGSIEALKTFFSCMPEDSGLAFVVVLHLSPKVREPFGGSAAEMDTGAGNSSLRADKGGGKLRLRNSDTQAPFNGRRTSNHSLVPVTTAV
jgi:hypothetical protein